MSPPPQLYEVPDDEGFLGLVDPDAYAGFVAREWTMPQLLAHLRIQMRERRLLLWGTGREDIWRVRVELGTTPPRGFRDVTGPIVSTRGRLLLTHWGTLTMVASYADVPLPEAHEEALLLTVPPDAYRCTVVQIGDPQALEAAARGVRPSADFVIVLTGEDSAQLPWTEFPWTEGWLG